MEQVREGENLILYRKQDLLNLYGAGHDEVIAVWLMKANHMWNMMAE